MGYLSKNSRQRLLRSAMTFLSVSVALQLYLTLIRLMDRFRQDMRNQFSVFAGKDFVQQVMPARGLGWDTFPSLSSSIQAETASELLQLAHVDSPSSTTTLFVQGAARHPHDSAAGAGCGHRAWS